jgi:hypothetical protein
MARSRQQAERAKGFGPRRGRLPAGQSSAAGALGAPPALANPGASEARMRRGILPSCDKVPRTPRGAESEPKGSRSVGVALAPKPRQPRRVEVKTAMPPTSLAAPPSTHLASRLGASGLALILLNACAAPPLARPPAGAALTSTRTPDGIALTSARTPDGAALTSARTSDGAALPRSPASTAACQTAQQAAPGEATPGAAPAAGTASTSVDRPPSTPEASAAGRFALRTPPRAYELDPPPPSDWRKPVGAIGLAVGTTMVAMGVAGTLRISKVNQDFREGGDFLKYQAGLPPGSDLCDAADLGVVSSEPGTATPTLVRTRCHTRSVWKIIQPLGFVGGGLFLAGGAALLVSSAVAPFRAEETRTGGLRLRFSPTWGPRSAGATLGGTW